MNVLLDHCVPKPFVRLLIGHDVRTCASMGWDELDNGQLLIAASTEFDVFVTVDKNMQFQRHSGSWPLPVVSLDARTNRPDDLAPFAPRLLLLLAAPLEN